MNEQRRQAASFLAVGALSTGLHFVLLFVCTGLLGAPVVAVSTAGYVIFGALNYQLNRQLTFRSDAPHRMALSRFLLVAAVGFVANGLLMQAFAVTLGIHYLVSQVLTTGIVLVWNFLANRYWTFAAGPVRNTRS